MKGKTKMAAGTSKEEVAVTYLEKRLDRIESRLDGLFFWILAAFSGTVMTLIYLVLSPYFRSVGK